MVSSIPEMKIQIVVRGQIEEAGTVEQPRVVVERRGHGQVRLVGVMLVLVLLLLLAEQVRQMAQGAH